MASALRRSAVRATLAPSVRNTQPWRLVLRGRTLEIHADWTRQLKVLDRRGQQLLISCGAAALNARVSLAASGYEPTVERYPDPADSDLVIRLTVTDARAHQPAIGALDAVIERARINRRPFVDERVPTDLVDVLIHAAAEEGAELVAARRPEHQRAIGRLTAQADALEEVDPGYRADLRASAVGGSRRGDEAGGPRVRWADAPNAPDATINAQPVRWSTIDVRGDEAEHCLLVLGCAEDTPVCWLRTGEALQRVLLEITRRGYAVSPFAQALEIASTGFLLREQLGLLMYPQVVLRVGRAPSTVASRRRHLVDMLEEVAD
jgi:hypothetical protein